MIEFVADNSMYVVLFGFVILLAVMFKTALKA